jgi:hypothetical protein
MLKWTFRAGFEGHEWNASETEKLCYSIALKCDEVGNVSFVVDRISTNDGLAHEDIGNLQQECATLEEAKRTVAQWHAERYADNDAEFDEYGGNTAAREQFETGNGLGTLSAGRVASRSPTVTGSRGFSITGATLNARPAPG